MILSAKTLRRLIREGVNVRLPDGSHAVKPLITPVPDERLRFIEGSAYDLTLEAVHVRQRDYYTAAEIGIEHRVIPPTEPHFISDEDPQREGKWGWWIISGTSALLQSVETVNVPDYLNGVIKPRTSLFRSLATVTCADAHPNYQGKIVVLLTAPHSLWLEKGCRFASIKFEEFDSDETDAYEGIWTGSKVTTDGKSERGS
jgi:deoxycytidine triphosphate deaminase